MDEGLMSFFSILQYSITPLLLGFNLTVPYNQTNSY
jgi:hypothetical protein